MKIAFRFEARSDTGVKRSKNDDSGYGGRYLAVVADGMGGHVGGDVASATAVLNLTPLDHPDFDGTGGIYLADEIQSANAIINDLATSDQRLAGMGTTCTALLVDGEKIEMAHIGDSRAYRLRAEEDGGFEQISTDHTFVQRLLNEGRITPEEAENHPHRNVIMRVLGDVDASPELELQTLEAIPGERWVLASDGLEAVVSDEEIEAVMRSTDDLGEIADVLIQMTLDGGAPDNVTVVVVQVIDREELPADEPVGPSALPETGEIDTSLTTSELEEITEEVNAEEGLSDHDRALKKFRRARDLTDSFPHDGDASDQDAVYFARTNAAILRHELGSRPHQLVGSAAVATETGRIPAVTSRTLEHRASLAQRVPMSTEEPAKLPDELEELLADPIRRRRRPILLVSAAVILVLALIAGWSGLKWVEGRYYVGENNGKVAVYNGVPQSLGPIHLSHVVEESEVETSQLPEHTRMLLKNTIHADNLDDARVIVNRMQAQVNLQDDRNTQPSGAASSGAQTGQKTSATEGGNRG